MNKLNLNKDEIINSLNYDKKTKEYIKRNLIFLTVSGSHAYGMNTPESDIDIRGIFIGEKQNLIGNDRIEQFENSTNDIVIYELKKAINLISEQNPNMHELLFVDEEDIIYATDEYWNIRKHNKEFLSSLSRQKYSGYAMSQLHRIRGHNKWLIKEQNGEFDKKPEMIDYCRIIMEYGETIRDNEQILLRSNAYVLTHETNTMFKVWDIDEKNKNGWFDNKNYTFRFKKSIQKEKKKFRGILLFAKNEFNQALDQYNGWRRWKENRNEKRHELEEEHGYDTKHASHLFRLLRMGYEILTKQTVNVKRQDAQELLDIRNGKLSYNEIVSYAENMDNIVLEEAYKNTKLLRSVDKDFVNKILIETYENFWSKKTT